MDLKLDNFNPIGIAVLIEPDSHQSITDIGLIIPETINPYEGGKGQTGTVLKVGPRYNEETGDELVPGDRVVFMPVGIKEVIIEDKPFILSTSVSHPRTILAKLND